MGVSVREKKKGSGVYWVFVKVDGKRTSKKVGSLKLANKVAHKLRARLALGDTSMLDKEEPKATVPTFREYSMHWLEDYIKPVRRPATYQRYEGHLRKYLIPALGKKPLDQVRRADVRKLILKCHKKKLSTSSLCSLRDVVSGVFNYAMDEDYVKENPAKGVMRNLQIKNSKRSKSEPFNKSEVDKILSVVKQHYPDHYLFFLCAFRTGMRMGELSGLRWDDIDLENRRIKVQRSYKNGRVSSTKTDKVRWVDVSSMLFEELQASVSARSVPCGGNWAGAEAIGADTAASYVFASNGDKPIRQGSIRAMWRRILKKAGLTYRKFHDIRHTFASLLLSQGESPVYVKEQLGHSSIQITVDIYGHWMRTADNGRAVDQLDT